MDFYKTSLITFVVTVGVHIVYGAACPADLNALAMCQDGIKVGTLLHIDASQSIGKSGACTCSIKAGSATINAYISAVGGLPTGCTALIDSPESNYMAMCGGADPGLVSMIGSQTSVQLVRPDVVTTSDFCIRIEQRDKTAGDIIVECKKQELNEVLDKEVFIASVESVKQLHETTTTTTTITTPPLVSLVVSTTQVVIIGSESSSSTTQTEDPIIQATTTLLQATTTLPQINPTLAQDTTLVTQATTVLPQATTVLPQATTVLPQATTVLPQATTTLPPTVQTADTIAESSSVTQASLIVNSINEVTASTTDSTVPIVLSGTLIVNPTQTGSLAISVISSDPTTLGTDVSIAVAATTVSIVSSSLTTNGNTSGLTGASDSPTRDAISPGKLRTEPVVVKDDTSDSGISLELNGTASQTGNDGSMAPWVSILVISLLGGIIFGLVLLGTIVYFRDKSLMNQHNDTVRLSREQELEDDEPRA